MSTMNNDSSADCMQCSSTCIARKSRGKRPDGEQRPRSAFSITTFCFLRREGKPHFNPSGQFNIHEQRAFYIVIEDATSPNKIRRSEEANSSIRSARRDPRLRLNAATFCGGKSPAGGFRHHCQAPVLHNDTSITAGMVSKMGRIEMRVDELHVSFREVKRFIQVIAWKISHGGLGG